MARRTKQEAEETRLSLLDAAEHVFILHGVTKSTLDQIAERAGTTRGAIYWHFKDKAGLIQAMGERIAAPIIRNITDIVLTHHSDPLVTLTTIFLEPLRIVSKDEHTRNVISILSHMVEYSAEFSVLRGSSIETDQRALTQYQQCLRQASRHYDIKFPVPVALAARGLYALFAGLLKSYVLEPTAFDLVKVGRGSLYMSLVGMGFSVETLRAHGLTPSK